ncbi:27649_t:CDS:1, partial [Dentiscutata erythropus]
NGKKKRVNRFRARRSYRFYLAGDSEQTIPKKTGYGKTTIHNIIPKYRKNGNISVAFRSG